MTFRSYTGTTAGINRNLYFRQFIGYEFVRDTVRLAKEAGLQNVLVTNGTASQKVLDQILPYIDAMNIDLKAFTDHF